jgi:glycosyltransferase 2 family protein
MLAKLKSYWAKPAVRHGVTICFFAIVALLLFQHARTIAWNDVLKSIRAYDAKTLAAAAALSALSYAIYSCFDLLGRYYTRIKVHPLRVMNAGFVSFAFNQSLGSLIGAVALRVRLYSRLGVSALQTSKIIGLSITTNWLGYFALAGVIFVAQLVEVPPNMDLGPSGWDFGRNILRVLGILMLLCVGAYLTMCVIKGGDNVTILEKRVTIPGWRLAALQLFLSIAHWPTAAAILYVLLGAQAEFVTILGSLLLTAVAVVLTHIPAGLGVMEAIFVGLLRHRIPPAELLAALLVFRAFYHVAPLGIATLLYLRVETSNPARRAATR